MSKELFNYVKEQFKDSNDYIETDDEGGVNVKVPNSYFDIPQIEEIEGHEKVSIENIKEYFDAIKNGNMRIMMINGVNLGDDGDRFCDFCRVSTMKNGDDYYYCKECRIDMCNLCFDETDEQKAKANGAKNFEKRKDALERCRKHDLIKKTMNMNCWCDLCSNHITDSERYSNKVYNNKDVCIQCFDTDEGKEYIKKNKLEKLAHKYERPSDTAEFGSMLDWIPIIRDEECNALCLNLNTESPYYNQICLQSCDNHGRCGFYSVDVSLEEALENIKKFQADPEWKKLEGWKRAYNVPIKQYMASMNMQTHYG